jgi:hypothetical protein
MGKRQQLSVVFVLCCEQDRGGLLTFILQFESQSLKVLLNEDLLGTDLHKGASVFLQLDILVHSAS